VACTSADAPELDPSAESPDPSAASSDPQPSGVTVVTNADVYTVDQSRSRAEAFAYDADGVIIAVGTEVDVFAAVGTDRSSGADVIDAGGRLVLPGFQDAHVHVPEAGLNAELCFFPDGLVLDDYEALAVKCAAEQAGSDWVRAAGAPLFDLRDTPELPLAVLDRAVPDRPAIVLDNLGHAVWTNSLGLAAAGIDAESPDPQGGVFHRNADGELTGLLLEDAQQLVRNAAAPNDETNYRGLLIALDELASQGVTTISDAGGFWGQNHPAAWQRAADARELTVRAFNSLYVYPDLDIDEQLAEFKQRFSNNPESLLQFDTAKVYVDGILDLGTAKLLEPYDVPTDANYPNGFDYFTAEQLQTYVTELHAIGYRINFHAVGDAAVRDALDAVEAIAESAEAIAQRRHRLTHTYLVNPADLPRFAGLGVIVDHQQSADAVATDYHDFLAEFIGERADDLIPTATLLEAGVAMSLSSDWDAGPLPPLGTIERSLTREANAVPDLDTAIALVTIDAAFALGHDGRTGSIEVGKQADWILLDQNIFDGAIESIDDAVVLLTVLAGTEVYRSTNFSS